MKKINLLVLFCSFFHCMQLHASYDCKKNDTSVMKIRHTSATHSVSINNENLACTDDSQFDFHATYYYLQHGFDALRTHGASMKFSDFLQYETGCAVDTRKKLDAVIVQKAENFIAEGMKDRFWQKLMDDALYYKHAWIPALSRSPFLMDLSNPVIAYVIAYREDFTKSEFLKCIHNKNMQGETVFDIAMQDYDKHSEFIDMVMQVEPNIYLHTSDNIIPLLAWAIKNNKPQVYSQLVCHKKIDFNLQDSHGWTALHHAVYKDDLHAIPLLLTSGLDTLQINIQDHEGDSALHWAWSVKTLSCLLQQPGIDLNIQNHEGQTAVHKLARLKGYPEELGLLLKAGALVNIQDNNGKTPIDIAKEWECFGSETLLLQYKRLQERSDKA